MTSDSALIEDIWDPSYYIVSVFSPTLLLLMQSIGIQLYILQGFLITMLVLCFAGEILGQMRVLIQTGSQVVVNEIGHGATTPQEAINRIFAGAFGEVVPLASCT